MSGLSYKNALEKTTLQRGIIFSFLIVGALLAFELFNYSTTEFAINDLLGDLRFAGIRWSTILAIAFCGIDFAGIARLFTPEQGEDEPMEVWYLFGAWLIAATMNAILTWWGVSIAIVNHKLLSVGSIPRETLIYWIPIFVACMVWLARVLIIGTFSVAGERLFSEDFGKKSTRQARQAAHRRRQSTSRQRPRPSGGIPARHKGDSRAQVLPTYAQSYRDPSDDRGE